MRKLIALALLALAGCAGAPPEPDPVVEQLHKMDRKLDLIMHRLNYPDESGPGAQ